MSPSGLGTLSRFLDNLMSFEFNYSDNLAIKGFILGNNLGISIMKVASVERLPFHSTKIAIEKLLNSELINTFSRLVV